jgi:hypothetical protein
MDHKWFVKLRYFVDVQGMRTLAKVVPLKRNAISECV